MKTAFLYTVFFCQLVCGYAEALTGWDGVTATASSELSDSQGSYPAQNLIDASFQTWAEGARGNGTGESFTLTTGEPKQIAGFALKNGYGDLNYFLKNNRVKSFKIYIDDTYIETIAVKDSIHFEQYALKTPVTGERFQFVLDSVYPGTAWDDTCVAEIALLTDVLSDKDFYNAVLRMVSIPDEGPTQYINHRDNMESVSDPDKIRLLEYMPFATDDYHKTNIAVLDTPSSLRLSAGVPRPDAAGLPRLDGATALYPLYSAFVHAVYPQIEAAGEYRQDWPYFPSREAANYFFSGILSFSEDEFSSMVQCSRTAEAYQRLIDGEADLIFCYEPSAAGIEAARAKGISFNLTPIAKDAFVFIVNGNNTVNSISQAQIRDIYSGRLTNWKSISGADDVIIPYQRNENSGSQTIFQTIMRGEKTLRPIIEGHYIPWGMFGMIEMVASNYYNYTSAIGYTFLFYLNRMTGSPSIKTLSIDGIPPTRETIRSGTYPFTQTVYAVSAGKESENTKRFVGWIRSAQGQELVEKTGYIPLDAPGSLPVTSQVP
jgi:phosphate transport system substrate-binding protein